MKLATWVIRFVLPLAMHNAFAADSTPPAVAPSLIEGSYFITFTDPVGAEKPILDPPGKLKASEVSFGEHSSGQSKQALEKTLGLNGKVMRIFDTINSIHVLMDAKEAYRVSQDKRVKHVTQNRMFMPATAPPDPCTLQPNPTCTLQSNPGWGLDRLDQSTPTTNNQYTYRNTGAGKTIFILDSGLALDNAVVRAEFDGSGDSGSSSYTGRAKIFYDFNHPDAEFPLNLSHSQGGNGFGGDCFGHGTKVASVAAGKIHGVAKGATLQIVKVSQEVAGASPPCGYLTQPGQIPYAPADRYIAAINYIAASQPRGTIINISNYLHDFSNNPACANTLIIPDLETAILYAHSKGIIIVNSAGNDGCDTAHYTPSNMPHVFVVGATSDVRFPWGQDALMDYYLGGYWWRSRKGTNISAFAPGQAVPAMKIDGATEETSGTSMVSPYVAGMFALYCQSKGSFCTDTPVADIYQDFRNVGILGTVTESNGNPLSIGTSRFIRQQW